jgi:D-alanyl-D-alanine carboxypeptidase
MEIDAEISAPIERGQQLGLVNIRLDETLLLSENIIAMQPVAEGSLFVRAMDRIKLMFR